MTQNTSIIGFPRIGERRELKKALESYWAGKSPIEALRRTAEEIRKKHWLIQKEHGIEYISSNDFSLYDNMLDTAIMVNAVPSRFRTIQDRTERYFAMARGTESAQAMEMTKWFNTNYHYIVPELGDDTVFSLDSGKVISEYLEAKKLGIKTKINLIGPLTFLSLSRGIGSREPLEYLKELIPVYEELLREVAGLDDSVVVQFEEPVFVKDPDESLLEAVPEVYSILSSVSDKVKIVVTSYFEHSTEAAELLAETGIWGIGLDFVHGRKNFGVLKKLGGKVLFAGLIDGRNIWADDYRKTVSDLERILGDVPADRVVVSTSCSLLHVPYSAAGEPDGRIRRRLAFACEKTAETAFIGKVLSGELSGAALSDALGKRSSILNPDEIDDGLTAEFAVKSSYNYAEYLREGDFIERRAVQKEILDLPALPTTTIGSFPQTPELRKLRRAFRDGSIGEGEYEAGLRRYIRDCIAFQEEAGLDVLVHGEPERNDMVEYFGQHLRGFHFTENGWVQSYGSRCVKPPVIYGDISRKAPFTVKWIEYAQSLTKKPVKGMLTGPVTIISWSFIREDIPKAEISKQIALALSDEIADLQQAGIRIIQVDEAAFREGYPLRSSEIAGYEKWAVGGFHIAVGSAWKKTQIHTHMCYSNFNDIIGTVEAMDADVITIETARSGNRLLNIFGDGGYRNEIGPGVYDIHSPRVPSVEEFREQILGRLRVVERDMMWVNPDCGLKTRGWDEVRPALRNMAEAAVSVRHSL